ncbi:MAG TPA: LPS export ABC transporter periplasmic protein LptC [Gemmatimonadales bacterium]|jgi:LPS export ABC transporter protein LptC|nr:LPS export ABC transporter periplasmic protein LptC [Gemmatimonadales bacterium]
MKPRHIFYLCHLCGLCYLCLACRDEGVRPPTSNQAADTANQILFNLQHYVTELGIRRSLVEADTAYMYDPSQTAELKVLKVTFYDVNGAISSVLTSKEGTYHWQNGAMTARGDVVGTAPDGRTLRTSVLVYDPMGKKITSDQHFTFDRGSDHLEGDGFTSDPDFKNVLVTRPHGVQGGPQLLPGQ